LGRLSRRRFITLSAASGAGIWLASCVPVPEEGLHAAIRRLAIAARAPAGGIDYDPTAPFPPFAREHGLGMPMTRELEYAGYRFQGYAGGIVYAPIADPSDLRILSW
jgi:hypothetical protein